MSINVAQIGGVAVSKNSGNKDNGCQRVVIASDDVNILDLNTKITDLNLKIDDLNSKLEDMQIILESIEDVLVDVWDNSNNRLRVAAQLI